MIGFIGIDLGQKGALTLQTKLPGQKPKWTIYPFFTRHGEETRQRTILEIELYELLKNITRVCPNLYIAIERPMMIPGNGKKAIASLFQNYGLVKGILTGLGHTDIWTPTPMQWKKVANAPGKDKTEMLVKASKIAKAPNLSPITADSVLICEACRLYYQ